MAHSRRLPDVLPAVIAYFVAASISLLLVPYTGGMSFLWAATAVVIADLWGRPRHLWRRRLIGFAIANVLVNGLFGVGWMAAIPVAALNLTEAMIAARLLCTTRASQSPVGTLPWLVGFVVPAGIVAPAAVGALIAAVGCSTGLMSLHTTAGIVGGHALGNICFTPLVMLVRKGALLRLRSQLSGAARWTTAPLLGLVAIVTTGVFMQQGLPLLFLPILPLLLVSFRLGHGASGAAIVIVAVIGTAFTLAGMGPIQLVHGSTGDKFLFLQFFFTSIMVAALPIAADLENRRRLHRQLRTSEERFRLLAEHSTDIMMHLDLEGRIRYAAPSVTQLTGYAPDDLSGSLVARLVAPEDLAKVVSAHRQVLAARGATHAFEYQAVKACGERRCFEAHARAVLDGRGEPESVVTIVRDITERKAIEDQLTEQAMTDPLTGLFNRRAFEQAAAERCATKYAAEIDCVAVFDIDHFKRVNDRFGHDGGDAVLGTFARIMRKVMRETDIIARTGGEEFAVLLAATSAEQALAICDRLRIEMSAMDTLCNGARIRVTISGGVAVLGPHGIDRALKEADQALYAAKRGGRDQLTLAA